MKTKVVLSKKERERKRWREEKRKKEFEKGVDQGKRENGTLDNCPAHPM